MTTSLCPAWPNPLFESCTALFVSALDGQDLVAGSRAAHRCASSVAPSRTSLTDDCARSLALVHARQGRGLAG